MAGRVEMEIGFGRRPRGLMSRGAGDGKHQRLVILGDFSGRGGRELRGYGVPLSGRRLVPVDLDTFDAVMARFAPRLEFPGGEGKPRIELSFRELGDFHPDALYTRDPVLGRLRELDARLEEPAGFEAVASELRALARGRLADLELERTPDAGPSGPSPEEDAATLERLLGPRAPGAQAAAPVDAVQAFVRRLAASVGEEPSRGPAAGSGSGVYRAALDELRAERLRALLHDPTFQGLEGLWRSLSGLVSRLEPGEDLTFHLLDVTRGEVDEDLRAAGRDARASGLFRALGGAGAEEAGGPTLVAADLTLGTEASDLPLLTALGAIGSLLGAPFLAAAGPTLAGCSSLEDLTEPDRWNPLEAGWQELRRGPAAPWLGLALPRVLLRLPYGPRTEPVDVFAFDEAVPLLEHEEFLWGNPALFVASLLVEARRGPGREPGEIPGGEVEDLPAYTYREAGEPRLLPCAEAWLGERAAGALLDRGLIPVLSRRDRPGVRIPWIASVSDPRQPLGGAGA
ncbi:MAG: type VI secretion system contractile sheath large subunit [Deltaproteobacteria bacterium]|nr:type VI secretion system contractile sheath large subunit [Deltaproteobacteria bacterium]